MSSHYPDNTDPAEVAKFGGQVSDWWEPDGPFATLHHINPARLDFIQQFGPLRGQRVLDIGCGGGILAEGMASYGAEVTAIDASAEALTAARSRRSTSGANIDYREITAEAFAAEAPERFDLVLCMELLEHVPDPAALLSAAAALTDPTGHLIVSTINRTPRAFAEAVVAAEYLLRAVPSGTHSYDRFIRPSELAAWGRAAGLELDQTSGLGYNPFTGTAWLRDNISVNYLAHFHRAD